jgi:hypothetical protein
MIRAGFGATSGSESGSITLGYGSADPNPDPYQNVTDPQHWVVGQWEGWDVFGCKM